MTAAAPTESAENGRAKHRPRTTIDRLMEDFRAVLEESFPPFESSIESTQGALPASITVKVAFVPEKDGTDTKAGEAAQIIVSGKLALPTTKHEHEASTSGGQISLF